MIAYLSGKIVLVLEKQIIVKIPSGVGYLVNILGEFLINENVELFIWQDNGEFWGFYSWSERNWAQSLTFLGVEIAISCNLVWQNGEKILSQETIYGNGEIFANAGINAKIITKIIKHKPKTQSEIKDLEAESENKTLSKIPNKISRVQNKKELLEDQKLQIQDEKLEQNIEQNQEIRKAKITNNSQNPQNLTQTFPNKLNNSNFGKNQNKQKTNGILSLDFTREMTVLGYNRGDIVTCITLLKKQNIWQEDNLETLIEKGQKLLKKNKNM